MSRPDSYEFEKMYEYKDEYVDDGAVDVGSEETECLYGEGSWTGEIAWHASAKQYAAELFWTDHGRSFNYAGEGPMREQFLDDLYIFTSSQGIGYEEFELKS